MLEQVKTIFAEMRLVLKRNIKFLSKITAICVALIVIAVPVSYKSSILDSDMVENQEYLYTSSICTYDYDMDTVILSTRGKSLTGQRILVVGYMNVFDGYIQITNMPGLSSTQNLGAFGIYNIPLFKVNPNQMPDGNNILVDVWGVLDSAAGNDINLIVESISVSTLEIPKHNREYMSFSAAYYTDLMIYTDYYYEFYKDSEIRKIISNDTEEMLEELKKINYGGLKDMQAAIKELQMCYVQPELVDKVLISRKMQLADIKSRIVEGLINWGKLNGEKLNYNSK